MDELLVNRSTEAPIDGLYRYELIPTGYPSKYYIDLWYQYATGIDEAELLTNFDIVKLKKGDYVCIDLDGKIIIKKKKTKLKLVVDNG